MIAKFTSLFTRRSRRSMYGYLPEPIQAEIRAAMEATSRYDIP